MNVRRITEGIIFFLVLLLLGAITVLLGCYKIIDGYQVTSTLWVECVVGITLFLYHLLWRDTEAEKFAEAYAIKKQKLEEEEKQREKKELSLKNHYKELKKILEKWLTLPVNKLDHLKTFQKINDQLYLATASSIKNRDDTQLKLTIQHIDDEQGYPKLHSLLKELENHEKTHNQFVSSIVKTIYDEIQESLKTLPNLKDYGEFRKDSLSMKNVIYALHNPNFTLYRYDVDLTVEGGLILARSSEDNLLKLESIIETIRTNHKKDFEKIEVNIKKDERLLNEFKGLVNSIIYELALEKPLKGKCDYYKQFLN